MVFWTYNTGEWCSGVKSLALFASLPHHQRQPSSLMDSDDDDAGDVGIMFVIIVIIIIIIIIIIIKSFALFASLTTTNASPQVCP